MLLLFLTFSRVLRALCNHSCARTERLRSLTLHETRLHGCSESAGAFPLSASGQAGIQPPRGLISIPSDQFERALSLNAEISPPGSRLLTSPSHAQVMERALLQVGGSFLQSRRIPWAPSIPVRGCATFEEFGHIEMVAWSHDRSGLLRCFRACPLTEECIG